MLSPKKILGQGTFNTSYCRTLLKPSWWVAALLLEVHTNIYINSLNCWATYVDHLQWIIFRLGPVQALSYRSVDKAVFYCVSKVAWIFREPELLRPDEAVLCRINSGSFRKWRHRQPRQRRRSVRDVARNDADDADDADVHPEAGSSSLWSWISPQPAQEAPGFSLREQHRRCPRVWKWSSSRKEFDWCSTSNYFSSTLRTSP